MPASASRDTTKDSRTGLLVESTIRMGDRGGDRGVSAMPTGVLEPPAATAANEKFAATAANDKFAATAADNRFAATAVEPRQVKPSSGNP